MRWDVLAAPAEKKVLAQELVRVCSAVGWGKAAMRSAAFTAFGDGERWREFFPAGPRDAIWFISEVSDASMKAAFGATPAPSMVEVIIERLAQNTDLKPFVRRVMMFDFLHPFQALARMQRTSRVMMGCVARDLSAASNLRVTLLNLAYTAIVLAWLFDPKGEGQPTRKLASVLMGIMKL